MALVNIISLIESEAAENAHSLIENAKEELSLFEKKIESSTAEEVLRINEEGEKERSFLEKQASSLVNRNERIAISNAQQEVVDSVFSQVESSLSQLEENDLALVFSSLLSGITAEKGEVCICGGKNSESAMTSALKNVNKDFTVSSCKENCGGGFIFKGEGFDMDFSFSAVVQKELRSSEEGNVFKELF